MNMGREESLFHGNIFRFVRVFIHNALPFSSSLLCSRLGPVEDILAEMWFPSSVTEVGMKHSVPLSPTHSGLARLIETLFMVIIIN